jgi:transcriptional regulator with XRE-family HTH domain
MTPQETFITRLRRHRERNHISLDEIAAQTRIKRDQLEAFERGELDAWPRGIYARAWVRGYASVIGLDPIDTVDEFCKLFPQGDRRAHGTFRDFAAIIAHPTTYQDEFENAADMPEGDRRRPSPPINVVAPPPSMREQFQRLIRSFVNLRPSRSPRAVRSTRAN